jgi:hypothetical protein
MRDNPNGSYICIDTTDSGNIASFYNIHFIIPANGKYNGFFFVGENGNSDSKLLIDDCVFTSTKTGLKSILIFNGRSNLQISANGIVMDGINSSMGFFFFLFYLFFFITSAAIYMNGGSGNLQLSDSTFNNCSNIWFLFFFF